MPIIDLKQNRPYKYLQKGQKVTKMLQKARHVTSVFRDKKAAANKPTENQPIKIFPNFFAFVTTMFYSFIIKYLRYSYSIV